jgi:hypothetical protein
MNQVFMSTTTSLHNAPFYSNVLASLTSLVGMGGKIRV